MYFFHFFRHWDEFYSKQELQELFDSGISHIRIPVGYWLVDVSEDEPFPPPPATDNDGQRSVIHCFSPIFGNGNFGGKFEILVRHGLHKGPTLASLA